MSGGASKGNTGSGLALCTQVMFASRCDEPHKESSVCCVRAPVPLPQLHLGSGTAVRAADWKMRRCVMLRLRFISRFVPLLVMLHRRAERVCLRALLHSCLRALLHSPRLLSLGCLIRGG